MTKKEYAYSEKEKKIYVLNPHRFFFCLREKNILDEYQKFIENSEDSNLFQWLEEHNIIISDNEPWVEYIVKTNGNKPFKANEIHCFIKDAYGKPYIPGSSLKGALRTAILVNLLQNEEIIDELNLEELKKPYLELKRLNYGDCKKKISNISFQSKDIECHVLYKLNVVKKLNNSINDLMRAIRISDSAAIEDIQFLLCKKIDVSYQQGNKKINEINMLRESLYSSKPIELEMTINDTLLDNISFLKSYSNHYADFILDSIQKYSEVITRYFVNHFSEEVKPKKNTIYLGGGTGFIAKTILPALLGDEDAKEVISRILYEQFSEKHKHHILDTEVSPHMIKCTYEKSDMLVQFGMCEIQIEKL